MLRRLIIKNSLMAMISKAARISVRLSLLMALLPKNLILMLRRRLEIDSLMAIILLVEKTSARTSP